MPEAGGLKDVVLYALASCGSGEYSADAKKAVEICVSAGKLSSAYMILLYMLNGGGVPRYHPVPLPYVGNIEDICIINPEGLASIGVELMAIPSPEYREFYIPREEKETKKVYRVTLANVWGTVITYKKENGERVSKPFLFVLTRSGAELFYAAVEPAPDVAGRMVGVCEGRQSQPSVLTSEISEVSELLRRSGLGTVEEFPPGVPEGEVMEEGRSGERRPRVRRR